MSNRVIYTDRPLPIKYNSQSNGSGTYQQMQYLLRRGCTRMSCAQKHTVKTMQSGQREKTRLSPITRIISINQGQ